MGVRKRPVIRYAHVNIVAADWKKLADFYVRVLGCEPTGSERDHHGPHTDAVTGLKNVRARGQHLRVPGHGKNGPTLEIFSFEPRLPAPQPAIHRPGFAHIAFEVDDFEGVRQKVLDFGGADYGEAITVNIPERGSLTLIYMTDPEGNIIELQHWGQ